MTLGKLRDPPSLRFFICVVGGYKECALGRSHVCGLAGNPRVGESAFLEAPRGAEHSELTKWQGVRVREGSRSEHAVAHLSLALPHVGAIPGQS